MVLTVRLWSELCVFCGCWTTKKRDENLVTGIVNINFVYTVCVCGGGRLTRDSGDD